MKILVHLTHGPEKPTEADRAFLIARTAANKGHDVAMFLAGRAVELFGESVLERTLGVGETAIPLKESVQEILGRGGRICLSRVSCGARGVDIERLPAGIETGPPDALVDMIEDCDHLLTYG